MNKDLELILEALNTLRDLGEGFKESIKQLNTLSLALNALLFQYTGTETMPEGK